MAETRTGRYDLAEAVNAIPPDVHYDEHLAVGQALHHEGYSVEVWRAWCAGCTQKDHAKRLREIDKKWASFGNNTGPSVTGGTIVKLARDYGWTPDGAPKAYEALPWDVMLYGDEDEPPIVDAASVSEHDAQVTPLFPEGRESEELAAYLRALFDENDIIRYVLDATEGEDGRMKPGVGIYKRTAGDLLRLLDEGRGIEDTIGTINSSVGAYICINPLDGDYIGNKNVTSYRHALVESDEMERGKFAAIVKQLNLPIAAMVDSGNKSLHAIVKIDAENATQYAERVRVLYERCEKNGIAIDKANKNPSRLSRMPGAVRNGKRQFLAGLAQGAGDWEEWEEWYTEETDELPESVPLDRMLGDNLPPLKPALIDGLLRVGHKMLMSGPSKAGKSFALIALCIAFAEGREWFGMKCRKSHVMYVNLELDGDSCINRFNDMYSALGIEPDNAGSIDVWNLRGKSEPLGKLLPKLVRRCLKRNVEVVVLDPIYKLVAGDENSAGDMAQFANLFDALCEQAGVSVIYCHHHSKGFQGQKRSIDRASGSGVFGRDPDAILDMVELEVDSGLTWKRTQDKICAACERAVAEAGGAGAWAQLPDTGRKIAKNAEENAYDMLDAAQGASLHEEVEGISEAQDALSAWRVEGTLREFPHMKPVSAWFDWPLHVIDGALAECRELGGEDAPHGKRKKKGDGKGAKAHGEQLENSEEFYREANAAIAAAVEACGVDGVEPTRKNIHRRIGDVNGKTPSYRQVSRWTEAGKPWAEWVPGRYAEDSARGEKIIVRRASGDD